MGLSPELISELHQLLWSQCDGSITPDERRRLQSLVCDDAECRTFYVRYMHLHAGLYWDRAGDGLTKLLARDDAERLASIRGALAAEALESERLGSEKPGSAALDSEALAPSHESNDRPAVASKGDRTDSAWRWPRPVVWSAAALAAASLIVAWQWSNPFWGSGGDPAPNELALTNTSEAAVAEFTAKVTGTTDCAWEADESNAWIALGSHLAAGKRVKLTRGVAEITFHGGAKVLLQGPAELEVATESSAFLHSGTLTASVPERAHGFTIHTPSARVVDLGTEFGVNADDAATEVYVFRGAVELAPEGSGPTVAMRRLETGEARRITLAGGVGPQSFLASSAFPRRLWQVDPAPQVVELGGDLSIDFEGTEGRLDERWYVSGGVNTTRLRTDRVTKGTWGLSTEGTNGSPDMVRNVFDSGIDANTSMAWGPFFTVSSSLPAGASIQFEIAGSGSPWSENVYNGPAGVALWDLSARDFARSPSGDVIFVHATKNRFDLEPAEIPLEGLEGKTLGIVLVDRRLLHWGWTAVDHIRSTPGAARVHVDRRHLATIINDFDAADSLADWTGDLASFQLGQAGGPVQTSGHLNHMLTPAAAFPSDRGYLSSRTVEKQDASRGAISSRPFTLDGDVLEFYLAGTGENVALQLVAVDADGSEQVIASATTESQTFSCRHWPIHPAWIGRTAWVRLIDNSPDGYIEADAIRLVKFDAPMKE